LWPLAESSYEVSGVRSSLRFGTGLETRLASSSPLFAAAPPPLRRVKPDVVVAIGRVVEWAGWSEPLLGYWG
jgi:hypothetical protein